MKPYSRHDLPVTGAMGLQCRVVATPSQRDTALQVATVLANEIRWDLLEPEALAQVHAGAGVEIGVIAVVIDDTTDLARVERHIDRIRVSGGFVGVLGVCASCAHARALDGGAFLDGVLSLEWSSAPAMLKRFVGNHRQLVQNRAFKAYLDHSSDGYWIWEIEKDGIEWSRRTSEITGLNPAAAPKTLAEFTELIHPLDRDRVHQAIENHLVMAAPYRNIEMRIRGGDGRYGHFLASGRALRNEHGQAIVLVGSLTDRTLMQRVEQQLEDTQKRFTVLFHHMNDAAVLADIETGIILEANQPAERLWRKSISELVGSHQSQLHPPALTDVAKKAFQDHIEALMRNKRDSIQVPILRSDGTEVPSEISSSLIQLEDKTMVLGVFRDISDRVKADRELRERDAQLQLSSHLASMGTLAAGVAHEINNPLTYMLGNLEVLKDLLAERGVADNAIDEAIDSATTGGRYVREIVTDLKAMTKMDSAADACDPCDVIRIASRMALADLRHRARLDLKLAQVPKVRLSSARLSQVILNVLSNASHAFATSDQGANLIAVEVVRRGDQVVIVIRDNGMGIAQEDLVHVLEPFFTRRAEEGGTGLGLAICRRIITEAGGDLRICSEAGRGTEVTITLPGVPGPASSASAPATLEEMRFAQGRRVLVVDDDPLVATLLDRILRKHFEVAVFTDARLALEGLRQGARFDLVLSDIMMPGMDGRRFFEAAGDAVPFLFLTGGAVTEENIAFSTRMAGEGRLIYKPFEAATLVSAVRQALAGQRTPSPTPASPSTTIEADPKILAELKDVLGQELLRKQFSLLYAQLAQLCGSGGERPLRELANEAHRVAGAAAMLGLKSIASLLKSVQNAAKDGDAPLARRLLSDTSVLLAGLPDFVDSL